MILMLIDGKEGRPRPRTPSQLPANAASSMASRLDTAGHLVLYEGNQRPQTSGSGRGVISQIMDKVTAILQFGTKKF